jgi:hypothetical protein
MPIGTALAKALPTTTPFPYQYVVQAGEYVSDLEIGLSAE